MQNDHIFMMKEIEQLLMSAFSKTNDCNESEMKIERQKMNAIVDEKEKSDIISNMKAFMKANANKEENEENEDEQKKEDLDELEAFYVIDRIFDESPSHSAGLKCGDLIVKFGSMTSKNQSPQMMQNIVKQSINKQIPVVIKRNPEGFATLQIVPRKWNGRGLLGCHLTPYPSK